MLFKKLSLGVMFSFLVIATEAQVKFRDISISEALSTAKAENKLVFVYVEFEECMQCNEVASQGFANTTYGRAVNDNTIPLRIKQDSDNFRKMDSLFTIGRSFG